MKYSENDRHKIQSWLNEIESILNSYDWQATFILRTCQKKLLEVASNLKKELKEMEAEQSDMRASISDHWANHESVYITLYTNAGDQVDQWQNLLKGIKESSAGRPIYKHEADARIFVDAKENKMNEGYVKLYVLPEDIVQMPPSKKPYDQKGVELIVLRPRAIRLENVSKLVHANQYIYRYDHKTDSLETGS